MLSKSCTAHSGSSLETPFLKSLLALSLQMTNRHSTSPPPFLAPLSAGKAVSSCRQYHTVQGSERSKGPMSTHTRRWAGLGWAAVSADALQCSGLVPGGLSLVLTTTQLLCKSNFFTNSLSPRFSYSPHSATSLAAIILWLSSSCS